MINSHHFRTWISDNLPLRAPEGQCFIHIKEEGSVHVSLPSLDTWL